MFFTGVCLSTGGCLPHCMLGYTHPSWADTPLGRPLPLGRPPCPVHAGIHTPPAQCMLGYTPLGSAFWDAVNKQALRIPLECILVTIEPFLYASSPFGKDSWPYTVFHDLLLWRLQTRSELIFFFSRRFGSFEEFKKRNVDASGNLTPHKKLLCGLGIYVIYIKAFSRICWNLTIGFF